MDGTPRFNVTEQPQVIHRGHSVDCHVSITERTAKIRTGLAVATVFLAGVETGVRIANDAAAAERLPLVEVSDWPGASDLR
jgi:hypothetical protein